MERLTLQKELEQLRDNMRNREDRLKEELKDSANRKRIKPARLVPDVK